jgi:CheY-like chemotaxis protein
MADLYYLTMKLMIVDDHAGSREMIRRVLDGPGVTFCECATGDEAVLRVNDFQPDWITMDVHMPGLDGLKAVTRIKNQNPGSRIIIVTGDNQSYFRMMAHLTGATGYVCKENLLELRTLVVKP